MLGYTWDESTIDGRHPGCDYLFLLLDNVITYSEPDDASFPKTRAILKQHFPLVNVEKSVASFVNYGCKSDWQVQTLVNAFSDQFHATYREWLNGNR